MTALLGASRSSYDVRRAMDRGMVVLACPAGNGDKDRPVANFLVYDVLQAALSRKDTPPEGRRPFYVFFDEVQTYDGASRGNLPRSSSRPPSTGYGRSCSTRTPSGSPRPPSTR